MAFFLPKNMLFFMMIAGNFIFKIPNYKSQLADAKVLPHLEIQSESFYSSQFGYRLCASAFLNGNGPGEKSHVSLYVKVNTELTAYHELSLYVKVNTEFTADHELSLYVKVNTELTAYGEPRE